MKVWMKASLLCTVGFSVGFGAIYLFFGNGQATSASAAGKNSGKPVELDWAKLRELNIETGKASDTLKAANGGLARVPGFMIPLEDNMTEVSEFLLVPSPMACIHTPPPPANQIVHVRMGSGNKAKATYGPVWVNGRFNITEVTHTYGKASFEMIGESTEPYK